MKSSPDGLEKSGEWRTVIQPYTYGYIIVWLQSLISSVRGVFSTILRDCCHQGATIEIEEVSESGDSERCCHEETKKTGQGRALRYCGVK